MHSPTCKPLAVSKPAEQNKVILLMDKILQYTIIPIV